MQLTTLILFFLPLLALAVPQNNGGPKGPGNGGGPKAPPKSTKRPPQPTPKATSKSTPKAP